MHTSVEKGSETENPSASSEINHIDGRCCVFSFHLMVQQIQGDNYYSFV